MKKMTLILTVVLLSSCQIFLGPDPDNNPRGIFDRIWTDFDETYALMDVKGINWNDVYNKYSPRISSDMNDRQLFEVCADMLKL